MLVNVDPTRRKRQFVLGNGLSGGTTFQTWSAFRSHLRSSTPFDLPKPKILRIANCTVICGAMKTEPNKASLRDIARDAGVSVSAVSFALQNKPHVSVATRERILKIARNLGYAPDARLARVMTQVREVKSKDLLPIAWLNTAEEENAWKRYRFQTPYLEGAHDRALELGYHLEEIWCAQKKMTMRRLSGILYQRGIEGVIVTHPARHLRLDWSHLASVTLGACLMVPMLHRILADTHYNLVLALKSLRRLGYRRIGISLDETMEIASQWTIRATTSAYFSNLPREERVPPLFNPPWWTEGYDRPRKLVAWIKRYKPDVVVGHDNRLEQWIKDAGYEVPEDIGVVHLAVDDDVLDWAGIYSRRRQMGATAVEWLTSLMRNRQFGIPETPLNISIRGTWQNGRTLRTLKQGLPEGNAAV